VAGEEFSLKQIIARFEELNKGSPNANEAKTIQDICKKIGYYAHNSDKESYTISGIISQCLGNLGKTKNTDLFQSVVNPIKATMDKFFGPLDQFKKDFKKVNLDELPKNRTRSDGLGQGDVVAIYTIDPSTGGEQAACLGIVGNDNNVWTLSRNEGWDLMPLDANQGFIKFVKLTDEEKEKLNNNPLARLTYTKPDYTDSDIGKVVAVKTELLEGLPINTIGIICKNSDGIRIHIKGGNNIDYHLFPQDAETASIDDQIKQSLKDLLPAPSARYEYDPPAS
jgi:hypothetical protein